MIIKKCDICGKEEKGTSIEHGDVITVRQTISEIREFPVDDGFKQALLSHLINAADMYPARITCICHKCTREIIRKMRGYYVEQVRNVFPELFVVEDKKEQ